MMAHLNYLLDKLPEEFKGLEWRYATYYYKPLGNWLISENGILFNFKSGKIRYGYDNHKGKDKHQRVCIKGKSYYISRIVAEAFLDNDNYTRNIIVRHLDDNPLKNHYTNLKWGTSQENTFDAIRNKKIIYDENRKYTRCEAHPQAILTNDDIYDIVGLLNNSIPISKIAKKYNVDFRVINHIYKGRSWRKITEKYLPFPEQSVYNPPSKEIKDKIQEYLKINPNAKPAEIIEKFNLEKSNSIKGYIGQIKRKMRNKY